MRKKAILLLAAAALWTSVQAIAGCFMTYRIPCGTRTLYGTCNVFGNPVSCTATSNDSYLGIKNACTQQGGTSDPVNYMYTCNWSCSLNNACLFGPASLSESTQVSGWANGSTFCKGTLPCS
jgi:hypothetical protein